MSSNFDSLWDETSEGVKSSSSFDDLWNETENQHPEKSTLNKTGRLAGQFALGATEMALLPYEAAVAPAASEDAMHLLYRENVMEDVERLQQQKDQGVISPSDNELLDDLIGQIKDHSKSKQHVKTFNLGIRDVAEKVTGLDLKPEGILEKAAGWSGFIKNPKNIAKAGKSTWEFLKSGDKAKQIANLGMKPTELIKALAPGTDEIRGLSAGTALQMAEDGNLGPIGTLGAAIVGDVVGFGPKGLKYVLQNPKKVMAELTNLATMNNTRRQVTKQLAEDFAKSNLQMDVGTLTGSPLVKFMQAKLSQSGLTGTALDNFRKELSGQVAREYEYVANELGSLRFDNSLQASEAIKDALKVEEMDLGILGREQPKGRSLQGRVGTESRPDLQEMSQNLLNKIAPEEFRNSYEAGQALKTAAEDIKAPVKEQFNERWSNLNQQIAEIPAGPQGQLARNMARFVEEHEGSLLLGESSPESRVVQAAQRLSNQLMVGGAETGVTLDQLIKTKRTLADVANWEFGGSNFESAYKFLTRELDQAIERTLEQANPELRAAYQELNADYSAFKDMFENKNVLPLFEPKNENFNAIYNQIISNPDKMRSLEDIFYNTPRGQQLIGQMKRDYASRLIDNPNTSVRQFRDLAQTLGEPYFQDVANFITEKEHQAAHPLPKVKNKPRLGVDVEIPKGPSKSISGRVKESDVSVRKKMYEYLKKKDSGQVMKMMDSLEGIKKLKKVLSLTPEGKELFQNLSRYKIEQMIGEKMTNNMTEQVKLGTFSNLLKSSENKAIARELLGDENYKRLILLQKNAGRLAETGSKFFNASQSGSTIADIGLISGGVTSALMGNPFMAAGAFSTLGGMRIISNLLADREYLKLLEKAITTHDPKKILKIMEQMRPSVEKATLEARRAIDSP